MMAPLSCWVWPTAQTSPAPSAVMPFSRLPSPPRLGVLTSDHAVPFQCSTYGMWKFWPLTLPSLPEAQALLLAIATTPVSWFRSLVAPEHLVTFCPVRQGAGTTLHPVPSQCATKFAVGFGSSTEPTTQTSAGEVAETDLGSRKQSAAFGSHAEVWAGKAACCQL